MRRSSLLMFRYFLNKDPHEDTLRTIYFNCDSSNKPTVGHFVDTLKTVIINNLACKCLPLLCQDDGIILILQENFIPF
jgi:hypothetical protein